jgi:tetratricopeptide (TPR) repeat protein
MITGKLAAASIFVLVSTISCTKPDQPSTQSQPTAEVPLFEDLGSYHRPVTTTNELAQKYFDQGLRLVYGFNHEEAARAFREAVRLDPGLAMAWWGVAYTLGPNYNLAMDPKLNGAALEAVQKAQSLQGGASEQERAYIAAIATRYSADVNAARAELDRRYSNAMRELHTKYPDDNDAAVLYAESLMDLRPWQLWTSDGKPQEGTTEILSVLESVLARDPNHPGANHYYIHAIEASRTPEKGTLSAERLKTLVPGAGHLVHMPAHVYMRTGNYSGAMEANANAARVDEAYFARTKEQGMYSIIYYTHNFQFLSAAASMLGQSQKALDAAAKAVSSAAPMAGHEPMAEYVLPWSLYTMARNAKWDDILKQAKPADVTPSTVAMWHYSRGLAFIVKGDLTAGRRERQDFETARMKVPADLMLNVNKAHDMLSVAAEVLDARLAAASNDRKAAIAHWKQAVERQDRLVYDEPPAWYYPVRESLGGELLRDRQFAEAEKVFRRDLQVNPDNPRSFFGLSEALKEQKKNSEADQYRQRFEKAWQSADVEVSVQAL